MGYRVDDDCVGCPQGCVHCGRGEYEVYYCDKCGFTTKDLYIGPKGKEFCWDCYKEQFISKICDDLDEERCAQCGSEAEEMFQIDGEWVCEECLKDLAEKVED